MTKIAYVDCIAGASGDMLLGALVDAGLDVVMLKERLDALHLSGFDLRARRVQKHAFTATKVDVIVDDDVPERHLDDIERIVRESGVPAEIQEAACALFRRLGAAEAAIHGVEIDHVHLHELGGVDTIVDVIGFLVGLDALGIETLYASPLPLGRGFIQGAHGQIPLPAPATVALLKGVPVTGSPVEAETVTPTGAVLLAGLAEAFGPLPSMRLEAVGYGAGGRDLSIPNVVRILIGEQDGSTSSFLHHHHDHEHDNHEHGQPSDRHSHLPHEQAVHNSAPAEQVTTLVLLETNVDDLNPEVYGYVMERAFAAGALDVFFTPIHMKKQRPATLVRMLCHPDDAPALRRLLFRETTTLGVRQQVVERYALPRTQRTVETPYGSVRLKVAQLPEGGTKAAPEYDDCRRLARQRDVPLREIYRAALAVV